MKEFLKSVAEHYKQKLVNPDGSINCLGLSDYLFVFPNRRSGLFFSQYLIENSLSPFIAPEMTTISELFSKLSSSNVLRILDKEELLLNLYEVYCEVSQSKESFDSFLFWGEMILGDFNDADKYLVNAELLFKNLKDLKEIEEEFSGLEEDQIKVIKTFWTNFNPEERGNCKEIFRQTWQVLFKIYEVFKTRLFNKNAAYEGMYQRIILEELVDTLAFNTLSSEQERLKKLVAQKVVFVGLTALSKTELSLMSHLSKLSMAEFCWDYADPRLNELYSHASYFKASTIDVFPNVLTKEELASGLVPDAERSIEVIEVPSGVGQTVQAADILRRWIKDGIIDPENKDRSASTNALHTAVVLPDEKMLLPMLYSIPNELEPFNVTMGYSLKSTTISTLVDNLAYLQTTIQLNKKGEVTFYYKSVLPILCSNYLVNLTDGKAIEISEQIVKNNEYRVSQDAFKGNLLLEAIFAPCSTGLETAEYLKKIFSIFTSKAEEELQQAKEDKEALSGSLFEEIEEEDRPQPVFNDVEREFIYTYQSLFERLECTIIKYNIEFNRDTFFTMLHKLAQSESVAFTGEPLSGLQVMGVLETRDVDFENIIILSMNEGVFPAKPLTNTFIPMNLRHAFGMPTQEHRDAIFAYHFYRLISRAKNIALIYDSRSEGMQSGEPSRYIKQLSYLYGFDLHYKTIQYDIEVESSNAISIKKDEHVMSKLRECLVGGKRKLSASVLKYYISCPLRFYFEFVEGLREENEIEEGIDDKAFGSILHNSMEMIYEPVKGKLVKPADIDRVLNDRNYLRRVVEKSFLEVMKVNDITGYLHLVEEVLLTYVDDVLNHDKNLGGFIYIESEKRESYPYQVNYPDGSKTLQINIVAVYDRIDRLKNGTLRIVDYKTGKSAKSEKQLKCDVPAINTIFSEGSSCSDEAFQVLLYCLLYPELGVSPHLYFVRDFHSNPERDTVLRYMPDDNAPILNFDVYRKEFKEAFDNLLLDIFDESKEFSQCPDDKNCRFCHFKDICNRN